MDEMIYNGLASYFHALELKGYMSYPNMQKLLILIFFRDFVFHDYRGILSKEDYLLIEKVLDCLYGTTCLIPYPDYLKMGKLYLGQMTELAQRVSTNESKIKSDEQRLDVIEDTPVLKLIHDLTTAEGSLDSDVMVVAEES